MSFFRPIITESSQEFHTAAFNGINNDFIVGPYDFSKENFKKIRHPIVNNLDALILFDIPAEIIVSIDGTAIPGNFFDYFNPLLINSRILEKINFVNKDTLGEINIFKCNNLTSKMVNPLINNIINNLIYYPPGFSVDYKTITAYRSSQGKQICDFLSKSNPNILVPQLPIFPGLPFPIPIPVMRVRPPGNRNGGFHDYTLNSNPLPEAAASEQFVSILENFFNSIIIPEIVNNDEDDSSEEEQNNAFNSSSDEPHDGQYF